MRWLVCTLTLCTDKPAVYTELGSIDSENDIALIEIEIEIDYELHWLDIRLRTRVVSIRLDSENGFIQMWVS